MLDQLRAWFRALPMATKGAVYAAGVLALWLAVATAVFRGASSEPVAISSPSPTPRPTLSPSPSPSPSPSSSPSPSESPSPSPSPTESEPQMDPAEVVASLRAYFSAIERGDGIEASWYVSEAFADGCGGLVDAAVALAMVRNQPGEEGHTYEVRKVVPWGPDDPYGADVYIWETDPVLLSGMGVYGLKFAYEFTRGEMRWVLDDRFPLILENLCG